MTQPAALRLVLENQCSILQALAVLLHDTERGDLACVLNALALNIREVSACDPPSPPALN